MEDQGEGERGRPGHSAKVRVTAAETSPREESFPTEHNSRVGRPEQWGCMRVPGEASWSWLEGTEAG